MAKPFLGASLEAGATFGHVAWMDGLHFGEFHHPRQPCNLDLSLGPGGWV